MNKTRVLATVALLLMFVGLAHSFSWDIVVGEEQRLEFYYNGTLTHKEYIPTTYYFITSVIYDPVSNRVLFADYSQPRIYIYWITDNEIERARFDGSDREVLINIPVYSRRSLAIDQRTQKMYWIEEINIYDDNNELSIQSADFNGNNRRTLNVIQNETYANSLAVSKDFIYWRGGTQEKIWQLSKKPHSSQHDDKSKPFSQIVSLRYCLYCQLIATNYKIRDQTQKLHECNALKSLARNISEPGCAEVSLSCVHGTEVSGESRCQCEEGYTGERCDVSLCHNHCLQGNCSVSAEGQPQCSCKAGYSGERCEVNACHKHCLNDGVCSLTETGEPVCQCTADHTGERCEVSVCQDNCVSAGGETKCRCNAGNFKEMKVNACYQYCLNDGICSLNEVSEPVCQCTGGYEGDRCDVPAFLIKCFLYAYKNSPSVTLSKEEKSTCPSAVV